MVTTTAPSTKSSSRQKEPVTKTEKGNANDADYSKMTVTELKDLLRSKGLKVTGKKNELIERLESS